jgi:hypothetical protein
MKAFWHKADLSLKKLWSPRVKFGDTRGETIFTFVYWKELLKWNILPISIKVSTNMSCMMGTQFYSNEGQSPLQRGDNHKSAEIGLGHLNMFCS